MTNHYSIQKDSLLPSCRITKCTIENIVFLSKYWQWVLGKHCDVLHRLTHWNAQYEGLPRVQYFFTVKSTSCRLQGSKKRWEIGGKIQLRAYIFEENKITQVTDWRKLLLLITSLGDLEVGKEWVSLAYPRHKSIWRSFSDHISILLLLLTELVDGLEST